METSIVYLPEKYGHSSHLIKHNVNQCSGVIVLKITPEEVDDTVIDITDSAGELFDNWKEYTTDGDAVLIFTKDAPINYKFHTRNESNGRFASCYFASTNPTITAETVFLPYLNANRAFLFGEEYRSIMERIHKKNGGTSIFIIDGKIRIFGIKNGIKLPSNAWKSHKVKPVITPLNWSLVKRPNLKWQSKWSFDDDRGIFVYDNGRRRRYSSVFSACYKESQEVMIQLDNQDLAWRKLMRMITIANGGNKREVLGVSKFTKVTV